MRDVYNHYLCAEPIGAQDKFIPDCLEPCFLETQGDELVVTARMTDRALTIPSLNISLPKANRSAFLLCLALLISAQFLC